MENTNYISLHFNDEVPMLNAIEKLKENNEKIVDVLSPFPVHGLDNALEIKRSRIPIVGFIGGAIGALFGFGFQAWVFTSGYPLVFGGKPLLAVPSFIPVTFECTILFAGLSMVGAMLIRSKLKPSKNFTSLDDDITDDLFVVIVDANDKQATINRVKSALAGIQTIDIK